MTVQESQATGGRTVEKEIFIAAAPERVYRAFTERAELERWFVTRADIAEPAQPGGRYNLHWQQEHVPGEIVVLDPPHRFVFRWDDGPPTGVTTCEVRFLPHSDGTLLRLTHTGWGSGEDWDRLYDGVNGGWTKELRYLVQLLERGIEKTWTADGPLPVAAPA